jgi:hypothetical protein
MLRLSNYIDKKECKRSRPPQSRSALPLEQALLLIQRRWRQRAADEALSRNERTAALRAKICDVNDRYGRKAYAFRSRSSTARLFGAGDDRSSRSFPASVQIDRGLAFKYQFKGSSVDRLMLLIR